MSDAPRAPTLAYSSGRGRTPWRARVLIALLLASNLYFVHDKWRPDRRVRMAWHQRRAMTFEWPAGQVVFEGDPGRAAKLIGQPGYAAIPSPGLKPGESLAVSRAATERLDALEQVQGVLPAMGGGLFGNPIGSAVALTAPQTENLVVFLHELTSPAGNRRLVAVRATIDLRGQTVEFDPVVYEPGSLGRPMAETSPVAGGTWNGAGHTAPRLAASIWEDRPAIRVFAGRHDPRDPSRFTIEFENAYGRAVVDGRIDDADLITMKVVDDPDLGPPAPFGPGGGDAADEEAEEDEVEDADADAAGG